MRPIPHILLDLSTAKAFQAQYAERPSVDPLVLLMRAQNEDEIVELEAELAARLHLEEVSSRGGTGAVEAMLHLEEEHRRSRLASCEDCRPCTACQAMLGYCGCPDCRPCAVHRTTMAYRSDSDFENWGGE